MAKPTKKRQPKAAIGPAKSHESDQFSVRPDETVALLINAWLAQNPGWTRAQMAVEAIRRFVTTPQMLTPVKEEDVIAAENQKMLNSKESKHHD